MEAHLPRHAVLAFLLLSLTAVIPAASALTWNENFSSLLNDSVSGLEPAGGALILALQPSYAYNTSTTPALDSDFVIETGLSNNSLIAVYGKQVTKSGNVLNLTSNTTINTSSTVAENPLNLPIRGWLLAGGFWWIASEWGLLQYSPGGSWNVFNTTGTNMTSVTYDSVNNRLFTTSYGGGLDEIDLGTMAVTSYTTSGAHPLPTSAVMHALYDSTRNVVFVSTWGAGIFVLNLNHVSNGSVETSAFNATRRSLLGPASFAGFTPNGTSITVQAQYSNDSSNWTGWMPATALEVGKFAKLRATLSSSVPAATSSLQSLSLQYDFSCGDGTLQGTCTISNQPWYCADDGSDGQLVQNASVCGCPTGYYVNHTDSNVCANRCEDPDSTLVGQCAVSQKPYQCNSTGYLQYDWTACAYCTGGVFAGNCSTTQPLYCEPTNFTLTNNATYCGCPSGQIVQGNACVTPPSGQGPPGVQITVTPPPSSGGGGPPSTPPGSSNNGPNSGGFSGGGGSGPAPSSSASPTATRAPSASVTPTPTPAGGSSSFQRQNGETTPPTTPGSESAEPSANPPGSAAGLTGFATGGNSSLWWLAWMLLVVLLVVGVWASYELKHKPRYNGLYGSGFKYWLRNKFR